MGMPISSYNIMRALSNNKYENDDLMKKQNSEKEFVKKVLSSFSLFAFILYDPEIHPEFGNHINNSFDDLDYITGHKLLFFALVDPPKNWRKIIRDRDYVKNEIFIQDKLLTSKDNSIAAQAIAKTLDISINDNPQVIITKDFKLNKFIFLPTNELVLEDQLKSLGQFSDRRKDEIKNIGTENLFNLIKDELRYDNTTLISQAISTADKLTNILCFIRGNKIGDAEDQFAEDQIKKIMSKLRANIYDIKNRNDKDEEKVMILDDCCEELVEKEYLLYCKKPVIVKDVNPDHLENKSVRFLKTANSLADFYLNNPYEIIDYNGESLDYSPQVIMLAKVFENEINLSIVHEIRKKLNIEMPTYFNKLKPDERAMYIPISGNFNNINMNKDNRLGEWLPPSIGQSEQLAKDVYDNNFIALPFSSENWKAILKNWQTIRMIRNRGSHTELLDSKSYDGIKNKIMELNSMGFFKEIYKMKNSLRGNPK